MNAAAGRRQTTSFLLVLGGGIRDRDDGRLCIGGGVNKKKVTKLITFFEKVICGLWNILYIRVRWAISICI